jgi:hypothetical protein
MNSLHGRGVEHVVCATDLVLGRPVYFSSHDGAHRVPLPPSGYGRGPFTRTGHGQFPASSE